MLNRKLELVRTLLVVRDITEFTAEYLSHNLYQFEEETERHMAYALSNNLLRATQLIESELGELGHQCKERIYSLRSFKNVRYLEADLVGLVKKHIEYKSNQRTTEK